MSKKSAGAESARRSNTFRVDSRFLCCARGEMFWTGEGISRNLRDFSSEGKQSGLSRSAVVVIVVDSRSSAQKSHSSLSNVMQCGLDAGKRPCLRGSGSVFYTDSPAVRVQRVQLPARARGCDSYGHQRSCACLRGSVNS